LGRTGSGKSTLSRLLFRLYDPQGGAIRLAGADLRSLALGDLRRRVVLLLAGQGLADGSFTVGDFALFITYLWLTVEVPALLGTFAGDYKHQEASIRRLSELVPDEPAQVLVAGDKETRRQGDKETRRQGDKEIARCYR